MNTHYTSNTVHVPVFLEEFPIFEHSVLSETGFISGCPYGNHRLVSGFYLTLQQTKINMENGKAKVLVFFSCFITNNYSDMINKYVCVDCEKLWSPLNSFIMFYHVLSHTEVSGSVVGFSWTFSAQHQICSVPCTKGPQLSSIYK